jgi:hypothetical protein
MPFLVVGTIHEASSPATRWFERAVGKGVGALGDSGKTNVLGKIYAVNGYFFIRF